MPYCHAFAFHSDVLNGRIVMVASSVSDPGGLGRAVRNLSHEMAKACDVILIGPGAWPEKRSAYPTRATPVSYRCETYPASPEWKTFFAGRPAIQARLERACEAEGVAAIHVHGIWTHTFRIAVQYARQKGIRLVISPHGMLQPAALRYHSLRKSIAWWVMVGRGLATADVIHAASDLEAEAVHRVLPRSNVVVAGHPLDYALETERPRTRRTIRKALYLGRLEATKGVAMLVQAWAAVDPQGWRLTLAGPVTPRVRQSLVRLIERLGFSERVTIAPPVSPEGCREFIDAHDLLLHPSPSENFGLAIAESLCREVPVVATRGTPWADLPALEAGWCVEATTQGLAAAIKAATSMPREELHAMGAAGRRWMQGSYTWPCLRGIYTEKIYGLA